MQKIITQKPEKKIFPTPAFVERAISEQSKSVYGTSRYSEGLCYVIERPSRSIQDFADSQKSGLKTIVAHMYQIGTEIANIYRGNDICRNAILDFKSSKEIDDEWKPLLCSLPERLFVRDKYYEEELVVTMSILAALLIKDSYCMDQKTRSLIIEFLSKAQILSHLDKITLSRASVDFSFIYLDDQPSSASKLWGTFIAETPDGSFDETRMMIPEFVFYSIFSFKKTPFDLESKSLPSELEADWPLSV